MTALVYVGVALAALFVLSLTPPGVRVRRAMMARFYDAAQKDYEAYIAPRKARLFEGLAGDVLELGPGTGANFAYLSEGVRSWIGLEPNPYMHSRLRDAAARCGIQAEFRGVRAEGMDLPDACVDAVICTLVLCSLGDPEAVVRDVLRVLRPGGVFVFIEHVAAPRGSRLRFLQRLVKPVWWYFADGCRPDRETARLLHAAGFSRLEIEEFSVPKPVMPAVVAPQILGRAYK